MFRTRRDFIRLTVASAAAAPLSGHSQQSRMPVIGFLSTRWAKESASAVSAFRQGLGEAGFVEGKNVQIEYRWAENQYELLAPLAADLVSLQVAVIATGGGPTSAAAAKAATTTIPVVFVSGEDPVKYGLVASLNVPGGNLTGISFLATALVAKQYEMFRELVPKKAVAYLVDPSNPETPDLTRNLEAAAGTAGQQVIIVKGSNESELELAFSELIKRQANAVLVATDPFFLSHRDQIVALAARHGLPSGFAWREAVVSGGLMSYGTNIPDAYRWGGVYTGKILNGARPANLPVMQPTKFELVINLKTAKALGIEIPPQLLLVADEVIE